MDFQNCLDFSVKYFGFLGEMFWIYPWKCLCFSIIVLDFLVKLVEFLGESFIFLCEFLFVFLGKLVFFFLISFFLEFLCEILGFSNYRIVAWVTRPDRPKFRQLEVWVQRAPRLLVFVYWQRQNIYLSFHRLLLRLPLLPWNVSRGIKGRFYLFSGRPSLCCALNRARMRWWCADRPSRTYAHTYFHAHMRPYLRLFTHTHVYQQCGIVVVGGGWWLGPEKGMFNLSIFPDALNCDDIIQNKLIPWKGCPLMKRWNVFPSQAWWANPNTRQLDRVTGRISIQNTSLCTDVLTIGISIHDDQLQGGVSKTPGDHHTLLQHPRFRKHSPIQPI